MINSHTEMGHVSRFWDDDFKSLPFAKQPITDEEITIWHSQGYDHVKSFSGSMYDNRNPMPEKLAKALIDNRNEIMADRIADFIKKQSVFAAVGALHLPGSNGVIERLRRKGFVVEAVH